VRFGAAGPSGSLTAFIARGSPIPPHTGGDLNLAYKLAIRHRVPLAAVDYPPAMGLRSVELLLDLLRGRPVPRRVDVATEIVITRGHATRTVAPDLWADEHVRWDLPDDLILASGLGQSYDPRSFRVHYKGNRYKRFGPPAASRRPMANDGSGIAQIGRLLRHLAEAPAHDRVRAREGSSNMPRSTAFDVVRQLEKAAWRSATPQGRVMVGGWRLHGSALRPADWARSTGHAEALIPVLRDDTDATRDAPGSARRP